jgi:large subunit ribosomal protein L9e
MRLVHAHFPINAKVAPGGGSVEIKNFLGGAHIKKISMMGGTTVRLSTEVKDELIFEGVDNAAVSLMCSQVSQCCKIGTKDERKFLDGIYVSEKTTATPRDN